MNDRFLLNGLIYYGTQAMWSFLAISYHGKSMEPGAVPLQFVKIPLHAYIPTIYVIETLGGSRIGCAISRSHSILWYACATSCWHHQRQRRWRWQCWASKVKPRWVGRGTTSKKPLQEVTFVMQFDWSNHNPSWPPLGPMPSSQSASFWKSLQTPNTTL